MTKKTNQAGLTLIKSFEGFVPHPYQDPIGVWTIGYGSIFGLDNKRVTADHPTITEEQAVDLLVRDMTRAEQSVERNIKVPLSDNQFAALVSFVYNLGGGALQRSTLRMKLNREEYFSAADEFPKWCRANGKVLKGLVRRRNEERQLFLT